MTTESDDYPNVVIIGGGAVRKAVFSNETRMAIIAGPCQIEGKDHAIRHATMIAQICDKLNLDFVYKSSFDKANRSSLNSPRGVGIDEGLRILQDIREEVGVPVLTDVHDVYQCERAADVVDALQIPAMLSRQTDLLVAAGKTGLPVNIKKSQGMGADAMRYAALKVQSGSTVSYNQVMLCERGNSFGYNDLVVDFRNLQRMAEFVEGFPVIFDGTHCNQSPGLLGSSSGGDRKFAKGLTLAAVAMGVAGVFLEVHENPDSAPSDGECMVDFHTFARILSEAKDIDALIKSHLIGSPVI